MQRARLLIFLILIVVTAALLLEALHPTWAYHLRVDVDGFYYSRAKHFIENGNLTGLGYNEYQPGAVLFFLIPAPLLLIHDSADLYLYGLFTVNIILIALIAFLLFRSVGPPGVAVFAAILLFTGPILLYRFDLLVVLMLIGTILLWQQKRILASCFLLGIATATKIFPVLILPYLCLLAWRTRGIRSMLRCAAAFFIGAAVLAGGYLAVFQVHPNQLIDDASIHTKKPVHAESIWGTLLTVGTRMTTGEYARGKGDLGIYGIAPKYVVSPIWFYNYFWLVPMGAFYLWLFLHSKRERALNVETIMAIIALFLVFSKILTPQYPLWFMLLFPLLPIRSLRNITPRWSLLFAGILLTAFLSQYIYPLRYNKLLGIFFESGGASQYFWLLAARNALLVGLAGVFVFNALSHKRIASEQR
jgi:hypothetical protein